MKRLKVNVSSFMSRASAEQHYLKAVDDLAEEVRAEIITAAPGQSMTYEAKYQEALRFLRDGPGGLFPWLEGEAAALESTVEDVAYSIIDARDAWEKLGIQIEQLRLGAKKRIRAAESSMDMHQIYAAIGFDGI